MNVETIFEGIKNYKKISAIAIAAFLKGRQESINQNSEEVSRLLEIMNLRVSSSSKFSENFWFFSDAQEKAAKTLAATRFKIDFDSYESIPEMVIFEVKLAILMASVLPQSKIFGKTSGRKTSKTLKIQTVVPQFRSWLNYLNYICRSLGSTFGEGVLRENFTSLESFKRSHYVEHSGGFETTGKVANQIERVFAILQSEPVHEAIFSEHIVAPRLGQTEAVVTKSIKDDRDKVLPDDVFEKASAISGYIISDFLTKLGVEVSDRKSVEQIACFPFDVEELNLIDVDWSVLDTYSMMRLAYKGHPYQSALQYIGTEANLLACGHDSTRYREALRRYFGNPGICKEVQGYLDLVYKSAVYMITQYTGMRPSELVGVRLDTPLEESFGVPCLVSQLRKHQNYERSLFDDRWVCTPAMVDAFKAAQLIARSKANPFLLSKAETTRFGAEPAQASQTGIKHILEGFFQRVVPEEYGTFPIFPYVLRHTLAYQLFRVDLGLPFISHQLKHFGNLVGAYSSASNKGFSSATLGYGDIGEKLSGSGGTKKTLRRKAEVEAVRCSYDPDATYAGVNADEHTKRMKKIFQGYQAAGYTKEEIFEAMADQGMAIANVGTGMCYGGRYEDFDESLPCIGGLRCNPVRCKNAVVTQSNIPKWREVYEENRRIVESGEDGCSVEQAKEAMKEAKMVLESLGAFK